MIVGYLAKLKSIKHGEACVNIERTLEGVDLSILGPVFVAILRNMKDTNKRAFYEAMAVFCRGRYGRRRGMDKGATER